MKSSLALLELKDDGGDPADVVNEALATLTKTVDERLKAVETKSLDGAKLTERLAKVEAKLNRPANDNHANDNENIETKSFAAYLARGKEGISDIETKALRVSNDPGFLAPNEFSTEFIRDLVEFSPIRAVASVKRTSQPAVTYPKRNTGTNAKWKGENQSSEESDVTFGQLEVPTREMTTHVDISNQLLQDAASDVFGEVRLALAEDFGQKEATAFVNGDGVIQPRGFMNHPDIVHTVNGHATNLSADALITLLYALPATYRNSGAWLMNGTTLATIRKLKDGQNNYLWQPSYQAGQPETILGRPVIEAVDMPDVASGAFPILYGNFAGYRIIDRIELSILQNPYLLATEGMTRFHALRRVGGDVLRPAYFRKLKMAAS